MREFRTKVMEEGASEDVTKLLRERTLHAIYRNLESRGFIPPSLNEESFTTSLDKPDDLEAIDSIRIWQLLSQYLFSALEKDFFASELKTHRVGGRDFIQYLIQDSDRLLEVATDLETVANDNDGIDSAEALKRLPFSCTNSRI